MHYSVVKFGGRDRSWESSDYFVVLLAEIIWDIGDNAFGWQDDVDDGWGDNRAFGDGEYEGAKFVSMWSSVSGKGCWLMSQINLMFW